MTDTRQPDFVLPANVEAERTILGAILLDNAAHSEAAEKLEADDFSLDSHRRIFHRMSELMNAQRAVDIVTLSAELDRNKEREAVGGVAYLVLSQDEMLKKMPTPAMFLAACGVPKVYRDGTRPE